MTAESDNAQGVFQILDYLPVALTGTALGWMVGLSVSEVTGPVVVGVLAAATGFFTQAVRNQKHDAETHDYLIAQGQWKLAVFAVMIAIMATVAAYFRGDPTHSSNSGVFLYSDAISPELCDSINNDVDLEQAVTSGDDTMLKAMLDRVVQDDGDDLTFDDLKTTVRLLCAAV